MTKAEEEPSKESIAKSPSVRELGAEFPDSKSGVVLH